MLVFALPSIQISKCCSLPAERNYESRALPNPMYVWMYSKVPPLRNCIIRNSGLILVNKIPVYKRLSRLIHVQFLLQWYIVIFYGIYLNTTPISVSSLEIRMTVLSPNYYNFRKLSVLTQTIRFLFNCAYLKTFSYQF